MRIRPANGPNFVTTNLIGRGKRYWAFPANLNNPTGRQLVVTEHTLRQLMRHDPNRTGRLYGQMSIHSINKNNVLFRHPFQRDRNVAKRYLREYINPMYRIRSPVQPRAAMTNLKRTRSPVRRNNNEPSAKRRGGRR
jgi:hypothetical protein